MKTEILADFQISFSVPLAESGLDYKCVSDKWFGVLT